MEKKSWGDYRLTWICPCGDQGSSVPKAGRYDCAACGKTMFIIALSPVPPRAQTRLRQPGVKTSIVPIAEGGK